MADRRSLLDERDEEEDRRRSLREGMNVFDDEFEVEDFDVVADGFRPGRRSENSSRQDHDRERDDGVRSVAAHYAASPVTVANGNGSGNGPSRSSTRKSRTYANPFASPEDEAEPPLRRTPSGNFTSEIAHRSVSSASSNVYASTHSPRMATGGPSHPYGMYPQGTMARTPSVATQSTVRPQRNSSVRANGPAHPYTMYPQGVGDDLEDEDVDDSPQNNLVPVGFPGLGQSYRRRMGPEGEDQDLIGDFGHTEQLPPYTRYPEDGPEKPLLGVPDPPTALHSRAPVQGTDPGNPLMHTHLLPEQRQSMSDESTLRRQQSMASRRSTLPPLEPVSSSDTLMGKKSWNEKTWQERRRTRMLCGVPFIWLAIGLAALLFTGALVGGVIGGYVVGKSKGTQSAEASGSASLYDASLIATPTAVPLPTGTFALQYGSPEEPDDSCLVAASQAASWTCEFGGDPNTMINIGVSNSNATGASLYPGVGPTNELLYGLQVNSMATSFEPFLLVSDRDDPENGHAYYFRTTYDKVVVLPGDALSGGVASEKVKRGWGVTKNVAVVGDKPWFCYWNGTSVEGFIYADKPIFAQATPSPTSATSTPIATSNYTAAPAALSGIGSKSSWGAPFATPAPSATISTTFEMTTTTCTYEGKASELPQWLNANYPDYSPPSWVSMYGKGGNGIPSARDVDYQDPDDDYDNDDPPFPGHRKRSPSSPAGDYSWTSGQSVPVFPYLVKIEERRRENSPPPYCQQYQLLNDGTWNWIPDPDDDSMPITINLEERVPSYSTYTTSHQKRGGDVGMIGASKRSPQAGACHCQWMSGLGTN